MVASKNTQVRMLVILNNKCGSDSFFFLSFLSRKLLYFITNIIYLIRKLNSGISTTLCVDIRYAEYLNLQTERSACYHQG